jgi:predicted protein tyrosine phosphatase
MLIPFHHSVLVLMCLAVWLNLQPEPTQMFSILPMLADPATRPHQHRLAVALRLHLACVKREEGGIDAMKHLAVAPLFGFQLEAHRFKEESSEHTQYLMVSTLLHALNRSVAYRIGAWSAAAWSG